MNNENWILTTEHKAVETKEIIIQDGLTFGRDATCDIQINSDHISRQHAKLEVLDPLIRIIDLESANGVFVNDKRVQEAEVKNGDVIRIDDVPFVVHAPVIEDDPADKKTRVRAAVDINKTMVRPAVNIDDRPSADHKKTVVLVDESAGEETVKNAIPEDAISSSSTAPSSTAPSKDTFETTFDAMSDGSTAIGKVWEESDRELLGEAEKPNKTMVMPSVDASAVKARTQAQEQHQGSVEQRPVLVCKSKPFVNQRFPVNQNPTTIGRVTTNDIVINEASVSSHHAEIRHERGSWLIADKESYNGTYVNKKLKQESKLKNGDIIGIGRMQLQFELAGSGSKFNFFKYFMVLLFVFIVVALGAVAYTLIPSLVSSSIKAEAIWVQTQIEGRANPAVPVISDVNNDNRQDLVVAAESGKLEMIGVQNALSFNQVETGLNLQSSPLVSDVNKDGRPDFIVSSLDGQVVAFDAIGSKIWSYQSELPVNAILNHPAYIRVDQDAIPDVVIATDSKGVVAISGATGEELWGTGNAINGRIISSPLVSDFNNDGQLDVVVVTDLNQLVAFSANKTVTNVSWQQGIAPILFASPVVVKTNLGLSVVVASQNKGVAAYNATNGNQIWQTPLDGQSFYATPLSVTVDQQSSIVVVSLEGVVSALDSSNGKVLWSTELDNKVQATPAEIVLGNSQYIVVADTSAQVHIIDQADGDIVFSQAIEGADHFVVSPIVTGVHSNTQSDIILTSQNGKLFALSLVAQ